MRSCVPRRPSVRCHLLRHAPVRGARIRYRGLKQPGWPEFPLLARSESPSMNAAASTQMSRAACCSSVNCWSTGLYGWGIVQYVQPSGRLPLTRRPCACLRPQALSRSVLRPWVWSSYDGPGTLQAPDHARSVRIALRPDQRFGDASAPFPECLAAAPIHAAPRGGRGDFRAGKGGGVPRPSTAFC